MLGDNRKRLILIQDHILVRQGLECMLNLGDKFVVCEETGDAESGLELVRELRPDGAIVDVCLRYGTDGIDLTKKLLEEFPAIVVLILSAHNDPEYICRAAQAGAMVTSSRPLHSKLSNWRYVMRLMEYERSDPK